MVDIARKIREIRKNLGMTQAELASALNASQGSVSKWERGKESPGMDALIALGKVSGFDLGSLRTGREHPFSKKDGLSYVEVIGAIQPGYGTEAVGWDESSRFEIRIPTPGHWGNIALKGWVVKGRSHWPSFPTDTIVIAATEANVEEDAEALMHGRAPEIDAEEGDVIVCAIQRGGNLSNVTLKRVVAYENGALSLWDLEDFSGPRHPPVPYPSWAHPKAPQVKFLGVVAIVVMPFCNPSRLVYTPEDF